MGEAVITSEMIWSGLWQGFMALVKMIVTSPAALGSIAVLILLIVISRTLDKKKKKGKK